MDDTPRAENLEKSTRHRVVCACTILLGIALVLSVAAAVAHIGGTYSLTAAGELVLVMICVAVLLVALVGSELETSPAAGMKLLMLPVAVAAVATAAVPGTGMLARGLAFGVGLFALAGLLRHGRYRIAALVLPPLLALAILFWLSIAWEQVQSTHVVLTSVSPQGRFVAVVHQTVPGAWGSEYAIVGVRLRVLPLVEKRVASGSVYGEDTVLPVVWRGESMLLLGEQVVSLDSVGE